MASDRSALVRLMLLGHALALASCTPARTPEPVPTYVVRLRLPLDTERAKQCDLACRTQGPDSSAEFMQCLSECPDTVVSDDAPCAEGDQRPDVLCSRVIVATDGVREEGALMKILGVVTASGAAVLSRAAVDAASESARARSRSKDTVPGPLPGK